MPDASGSLTSIEGFTKHPKTNKWAAYCAAFDVKTVFSKSTITFIG